MTPAARTAAAIEILTGIADSSGPLDRRLDRWFRGHRFAGSKDRRAIRELTYTAIRHWGLLTWATGGQDPRLIVAAALLVFEDQDMAAVHDLFGAGKYAAPGLSQVETQILEQVPARLELAPPWARAEYPAWLEGELSAAFGTEIAVEMSGFTTQAPFDLRVNVAKVSRSDAASVLSDAGIAAEPTPLSPIGLRCPARLSVADSAAYRDGLVEVQDEGSQLVSLLVNVQPGELVVDYCAGAGGKSLALAACMKGSGRIVALDVSNDRLRPLAARAGRAGAGNIEWHVLGESPAASVLKEISGSADRVLVDAPCSGTGTWRRAPEAKWQLTPQRISELRGVQADVLRDAAQLVRPGGWLVYVTCSVLPSENDQQIGAFLAAHDAFVPVDWRDVWRRALPGVAPVTGAGTTFGLLLTPHRTSTDGFYCCIMERAS